jgi:hypothetical protein
VASDNEPIRLEQGKPKPKRSIDQRAALRGLLRSWLVYRDAAIWVLVCGVDPNQSVLEHMGTTPCEAPIEQMNALRMMIYKLAEQISEQGKEAVVREELAGLLSEEAPKFLLRVDGIPGAF